MSTYIKIIVFIAFIFSVSPAFSADNETDYDAAKIRVNSVQSINGSIPSGGGLEPKGNIGYIISRMFDSNGKIGNWFLRALGTRTDGRVLRWSGGNGGQLINGSIYDNGTNVGIGTAGADTKLAIAGGDNKDTGPIITLHGNALNQVESGRIRLTEGDGYYQGGFIHYDGSSNIFNIGTHDSNNQLTSSDINAISIVRGTGNVGIGINPTTKLHVSGGDGDVVFKLTADEDNSGENDNPMILLEQDGGAVNGSFGLVGNAGQIYTNSLVNSTYVASDNSSPNPLQLVTNSIARLTVEPAGDIGIGMSNPNYKLDVAGDVNFSGNLYQNGTVVDFAGKFIDGTNTADAVYTTGDVGIGTATPNQKLHVVGKGEFTFSDTAANSTYYGLNIDHNVSGADATTADRNHIGVRVDLDSSATGGDTNHEHRVYGVYADVDATGDSDIVVAGNFDATANHTSGTIGTLNGVSAYGRSNASATVSNLRGIYAQGYIYSTGTVTNTYGGVMKVYKHANATGTNAKAAGLEAEVEINGGTITNAYGVNSIIDRNAGTITNGYLFRGDYQGTLPTNAYGVYIVDNVRNYFAGNVGIGVTDPANKLEILGTTAYPLYIRNSTNAGHAGIQFTDQTDESQKGHMDFRHSDADSFGAGASFHFSSTEATTNVVIHDGDLVIDNGGVVTTCVGNC